MQQSSIEFKFLTESFKSLNNYLEHYLLDQYNPVFEFERFLLERGWGVLLTEVEYQSHHIESRKTYSICGFYTPADCFESLCRETIRLLQKSKYNRKGELIKEFNHHFFKTRFNGTVLDINLPHHKTSKSDTSFRQIQMLMIPINGLTDNYYYKFTY